MKVLFVCAGNVARSVMAEAILKDMPFAGHEVQSAGVNPSPGTPPHPNTQKVLIKNNLFRHVANKVSQKVGQELWEWADVVLTMENAQAASLNSNFNKAIPIKSYPGDISDPTDAGSLETFEKTFEEVEQEVTRIFG